MSKKEPPLSADFAFEGCLALLVGGAKLENADGCAWVGCWGEEKDRELNASFIPPKEDVLDGCCIDGEVRGGDCMPANAFMLDCGCCCCCCC